jgi:hypothetical protein
VTNRLLRLYVCRETTGITIGVIFNIALGLMFGFLYFNKVLLTNSHARSSELYAYYDSSTQRNNVSAVSLLWCC